jgi:tetratricopeptide (TPR) repeat protein
MKLNPLIKIILLFFAISLASCTYTTKLGDKLLPDSEYNTLLVKADSAMQDGQWAKAADLYEKAGQLKPENWGLKLKQAKAYQADGKLAQAFNVYQIIIDAKSSAGDDNDPTLQSAKASQAKLGFKNDTTVIKVDEHQEEKVSTDEAQVEEAITKEAIEEIPPIPEQSLTVDEVIQSPEQVESFVEVEDKRILEAVNSWAEAWSAKKIDAYFLHYVDGFAGDMANAKAWQLARKNKILHSKKIKITLSEIKINNLENSVQVVFKQNYESDNYQDVGRKTLEMIQVKGHWLIKKELFD